MEQPLLTLSADRYVDRYGASPRSRAISFVLALALNLLLFIMLIAMGSYDAPGGDRGGQLVAVNLQGEQAKPHEHSAAKAQTRRTPVTPAATARQHLAPRIILPSQNKLQLPEGFIQMSRAEMGAADIGRTRSAPAASAGADAAASGGGRGAGEGPDGAQLYNAEWYREPTDAELAGYMPVGRQPGRWAMIACRTIENFHVEDCRELGESPPGSGMARAIRQAAWQFLIRPPRINGKPVLGAWVRIRYQFTEKNREDVPR